MRIVLLRHGRTNLRPWQPIRAAEFGSWIDAYNAAGIRNTPPPAAAVHVAGRCGVIVTSDLARSVESGRLLGPQAMISDALFREAGLPYGSGGFIRMPPSVWALLFRCMWAFGFKAHGESLETFQRRARSAAEFLIALARERDAVLLVGHGLFNRYVARELRSAGWRGPGKTKIRHWGFTEYTHD